MASDEAIQMTNNDASSAKSYAVYKGYWSDPYMNQFMPISASTLIEHKPPEMSRGYFARVQAIRTIVNKFLNQFSNQSNITDNNFNNKCQIVNLGCGYDTLYFDLYDQNHLPYKYIEIDFPRIVASKIRLIKSKKMLIEKIQIKQNHRDMTNAPTSALNAESSAITSQNNIDNFKLPMTTVLSSQLNELHASNYDLISADLRNINELDTKLRKCNIDFSLPTLFIAECVLIYMNSEHSNALLDYLTKSFVNCCFLNYEQVNLNDKFGEIMLYNMNQRACKLLGVNACNSLQTQLERFVSNGFDAELCQVITMTDFYMNKMDQKERIRIESIEFLDETELLFQLLDHYCICVTSNNQNLKNVIF